MLPTLFDFLRILLFLFLAAIFMGGTDIRFHSKAKEHQTRVACVGDSITYGTAIPNVFRHCYPAQLKRMLGPDYHVANFGFNGKTAIDLNENSFRRTKQYRLSLEYQPQVAVIMIGTNDSKTFNWPGRKLFKAHYRSLLQSYLALPSQPMIVLCTPNSIYHPRRQTNVEYNYDIDKENLLIACDVVKEVAAEFGLDCIDMYHVTAEHPEWYRFDGIHPDQHGAHAIATEVFQLLQKKLNL